MGLFGVRFLLWCKFKGKFESLGVVLAPAVHGEMVPGGGGFHMSLLHEA